MNEKEILKRLNNSISHSKPNNLDKILLECEKIKGKEFKMKKTENKEKKSWGWLKNLAYTFGGVAFALVVVFGINHININTVDSIISLEVNPSIKLEVNKEEKVLNANALNEEGKTILSEMNLIDTDLKVAVNAIIGSMVKNGFITDLSNSILVSVENDDKVKGSEIQTKVSNEIDAILKGSNIEGAVLSQTVENKNELEKKAKEYGITTGKVQLIEEIIAKDSTLNFDDLAKMTINELNLIKTSRENKTENTNNESTNTTNKKVTTSGTSSTKSYIGESKAKDIALKHAGATSKTIYDYEIDFDSDNGILVYEIEFNTKNHEYEYDINAKTGDIIKNQKTSNDDYAEDVREGKVPSSITGSSSGSKINGSNSNTSSSSSSLISRSKAKSIALNKAGVSASQISDYEIELDNDNSVKKYEISFNVGRTEYDIEINAKTGKVIKYEKEIDD